MQFLFRRLVLFVCTVSFLTSSTTWALESEEENDYPIVLVHGLVGWGRDEMLGFKYWGLLQGDFQEKLKQEGHQVFSAAVGPFSSNWDRACELYAQIKGGTVDYGENHAKYHKHKRFGRTYPGFYPEWGTVDENGQVKKIHLVGHSMGGTTVRMLAQLLATGGAGATVKEITTNYNTTSLFAGGKDGWVHSITTISTPNRPALLADGISLIGDDFKNVVVGLLSSLGVGGDNFGDLYDVKLDQWGLAPRGDDESLEEYLGRVLSSPMFEPGFKDIALWSLASSGVTEEKKWVQTLPNIYYYSYCTEDSHESRNWLFKRVHVPNMFTMFPLFHPSSFFVGGRFGVETQGYPLSIQQNDGIVNTENMRSSHREKEVEFSGVSQMGKWNVMRTLERLDHAAVIGLTLHTQVYPLFSTHARLLRSLPASQSNEMSINSDTEPQLVGIAVSPSSVREDLGSAVDQVKAAGEKVQSKQDVKALCADVDASNAAALSYCKLMLAKLSK